MRNPSKYFYNGLTLGIFTWARSTCPIPWGSNSVAVLVLVVYRTMLSLCLWATLGDLSEQIQPTTR